MSTIIIILLLIGVVILAIKNSSQHFKGDGGCCSDHSKIPDKKLQEAASAKVNVEDHIAIVSYDREIVNQKLHDAIEKVGYHIISIKE